MPFHLQINPTLHYKALTLILPTTFTLQLFFLFDPKIDHFEHCDWFTNHGRDPYTDCTTKKYLKQTNNVKYCVRLKRFRSCIPMPRRRTDSCTCQMDTFRWTSIATRFAGREWPFGNSEYSSELKWKPYPQQQHRNIGNSKISIS